MTAMPEHRSKKTFAFVFPMMPGNLNPSLPIVRRLSSQGHTVHYLCFQQFREAICDSGGIFHDALCIEPELYATREAGAFGAISALQKEYGVDSCSTVYAQTMLCNVQLEMQLPGLLRFLQEVQPDVVVYNATINREAAVAADILKVPAIGLLTFAGPGAWEQTVRRSVGDWTFEELDRLAKTFEPNLSAICRINATYETDLKPGFSFGLLDPSPEVVLVSTIKSLRYTESPALAAALEKTGTCYLYTGPLLDMPGAKRAGCFKMANPDCHYCNSGLVEKVSIARSSGRSVVLVSMGTVVTGDHPILGWSGRGRASDGKPSALSGRELCRAVWAGVFDAFAAGSAEEGALVVVVIGPQADALQDLALPPNVVCTPSAPQVDMLRARPDIFVTHGGQNSFMEAIAEAVPVLVCPTAIDQFDNALQASELGIGLWIDRPCAEQGSEKVAASEYQAEVKRKLLEIKMSSASYRSRAAELAQQVNGSGGVYQATSVILKAANHHEAVRAGGA